MSAFQTQPSEEVSWLHRKSLFNLSISLILEGVSSTCRASQLKSYCHFGQHGSSLCRTIPIVAGWLTFWAATHYIPGTPRDILTTKSTSAYSPLLPGAQAPFDWEPPSWRMSHLHWTSFTGPRWPDTLRAERELVCLPVGLLGLDPSFPECFCWANFFHSCSPPPSHLLPVPPWRNLLKGQWTPIIGIHSYDCESRRVEPMM